MGGNNQTGAPPHPALETWSRTRTAVRCGCYEIGAHGCWGGVDIYTKDEIDLIAAYVVPENAWYLIPIEATLGRKRLCLHPNAPRKPFYRYEKYREAWWRMKPDQKSDVVKE